MGGMPSKNPPQDAEQMAISIRAKEKRAAVYRKSDTLEANEERVRNIVTMAAAGLAHVADKGQRVKLSDTETVKRITLEYMRVCAENSAIPNTSGLARALGMSRQALYDFIKRHPDGETTEWLKDVSDSFGQILIDAAITGVTAPIPSIFAAKARYGWREDDRPEITDDHRLTDEESEELLEKYGYGLPD